MTIERIRALALAASLAALAPRAALAQQAVEVRLPAAAGAALAQPPVRGLSSAFTVRFVQFPGAAVPATGTWIDVDASPNRCDDKAPFEAQCHAQVAGGGAGGVGVPGISCQIPAFAASVVRCLRVTDPATGGAALVEVRPVARVPQEVARLVRQEIGSGWRFPDGAVERGYHYEANDDRAVIAVHADGSPMGSVPTILDEDDRVTVAIVGEDATVDELHVAVRGCGAPPSSPRVDTTGGVARTASGTSTRSFVRLVRFGPCSGDSQVRLIVSRTEIPGDDRQAAGGTPIPINPLYRFSVGVAAGFDATQVRRFETFTPVGSTATILREARDAVGFSSLVSIGFHPCARDYSKSPSDLGFLRTICSYSSIFVGVDPARLASGFVVGLGAEVVRGLDLYMGWRVLQRNPVLLEGSGLAPGVPWDRAAVPTEDRWELGSLFLGVGLNQNLLRVLLGR